MCFDLLHNNLKVNQISSESGVWVTYLLRQQERKVQFRMKHFFLLNRTIFCLLILVEITSVAKFFENFDFFSIF